MPAENLLCDFDSPALIAARKTLAATRHDLKRVRRIVEASLATLRAESPEMVVLRNRLHELEQQESDERATVLRLQLAQQQQHYEFCRRRVAAVAREMKTTAQELARLGGRVAA